MGLGQKSKGYGRCRLNSEPRLNLYAAERWVSFVIVLASEFNSYGFGKKQSAGNILFDKLSRPTSPLVTITGSPTR